MRINMQDGKDGVGTSVLVVAPGYERGDIKVVVDTVTVVHIEVPVHLIRNGNVRLTTSEGYGNYDRELLLRVLVDHQQTPVSGCYCGWAELGKSWAIHLADMYESAFARGK